MNVIFFSPYPDGQSPSQRFRFEQYFQNLSSHGITYTMYSFWSEKTWKILYKPGYYLTKIIGFLVGLIRRTSTFLILHRADYVFIHRECLPVGPPVMEWLIAKIWQKKIIYDFDDAIWLPNTSTENKVVAAIKWHSKVSDICRWSHKVSCGNAYLKDYASKYARTTVLNPTTIDTEFWHNPELYSITKPKNQISIGWTGTHSTLKYLDGLIVTLQKIEAQFENVSFIVIADKEPILPLKRFTFIPWSKEKEIEDLMKFDIGVMPLTNDIWAEGKCGFKALQYLALNVPALVSPVGVNTEIIDHGKNGFLCQTDADWYKYLSQLIADQNKLIKMGLNGRKKVIDQFSVSSNSSGFLSLFE